MGWIGMIYGSWDMGGIHDILVLVYYSQFHNWSMHLSFRIFMLAMY